MQSSHWLGHTTVNLQYEVVPVECSACGQRWIDILELPVIKWDDESYEYKYVEEVECPSCFTTNNIGR